MGFSSNELKVLGSQILRTGSLGRVHLNDVLQTASRLNSGNTLKMAASNTLQKHGFCRIFNQIFAALELNLDF